MSGEGLATSPDAEPLTSSTATADGADAAAPPTAELADAAGTSRSGDTFPRQYARTRRLTLGEPRTITVSPDGRRVVFIRTRGGSDPIGCLWVLDVKVAPDEPEGSERMVADPLVLLAGDHEEELPAAERARRERAREQAGGVVSYATDSLVTVAAFALSGRLFVAGLLSGRARELAVEGPVFDPRPDPSAHRLAYVLGRTLRVAELDGSNRELAGEEDHEISWGSADFVAAEEMGRTRGFWWAPDGSALVAARVDTTPVGRWWISDPSQPDRAPVEHAYPAAGTANAEVTLWVLGLDGSRREVRWNRAALPYVVDVQWPELERIVLTVQSRDQRHLEVLAADPATGATTTIFEDHDDVWVELVHGAPAVLDDGRVVMTAEHEGARRLVTSSMPITPPELQIRSIEAVIGHTLLFTANPVDDATSIGLWRFSDGATVEPLVTEPGVHTGTGGGKTVVVRSATLEGERSVVRVLGGAELENHAEVALVRPSVTLLRAGATSIATAVLLPDVESGAVRPPGALPVLLDPYGGPHAQRVVNARNGYTTSQWFADQGFAVVVADGRGTPGRGSDWERAVHLDLARPVLEDQIEALHAAAEQHPLDLDRVAIRGWSFGGYLAALAVLRRPDVFHAAIAGAPVTDWRLYDTHYTERYLGTPAEEAAAYDRSSLIAEVGRAGERPARPLLIVHGLADDNVVVAHTLQLSSALLAAGRPHRVLPLSGVTHMTPQEVVAENLLLLQLDFLREALGISS
jgi:dipeptidyl-peptidase 4